MRFLTRWGGLLMVSALAVGCESTQPLQIEQQTVEINVEANNALGFVYDVWEMTEDTDGDGEPDGETYLWCELVLISGVPALRSPATVPWSFSLEISVIRKGETSPEAVCTVGGLPCQSQADCDQTGLDTCEGAGGEDNQSGVCEISGGTCEVNEDCIFEDVCEVETSPDATQDSHNIALYDDFTVTFATQAKAPVVVGSRTFYFDNGRQHPAAHYDVMQATSNPLVDLQPPINTPEGQGPQTYLGAGLCSLGNPGVPTMDDQAQPYTLVLNKGDTMTVTARMSDTAPFPLAPEAFDSILSVPPSGISIEVAADGRVVNTSGQSSGESISVSYTAR